MVPEASVKQTASIHLCEDMVPDAPLLQDSWWNQGALHKRPTMGVIYAVPIHTLSETPPHTHGCVNSHVDTHILCKYLETKNRLTINLNGNWTETRKWWHNTGKPVYFKVYPAYCVAFTVKLFHGHNRAWSIYPRGKLGLCLCLCEGQRENSIYDRLENSTRVDAQTQLIRGNIQTTKGEFETGSCSSFSANLKLPGSWSLFCFVFHIGLGNCCDILLFSLCNCVKIRSRQCISVTNLTHNG